MSFLQPEPSRAAPNFYNITRNFAFIGIMALGMVAVIVTGGIDLSVGSIMGLVGVVCGLLLQAGYHLVTVALVAGLAHRHAASALINGLLIAYVGLSPFVVTLGMLSFARSLAIVLSQNKMIYEFGPSGADLQGHRRRPDPRPRQPGLGADRAHRARRVVLKLTTWGRHLYSIGGNEQAARLTGVPVDRVKLQAYVISGLMAAIAAVLIVGWQGSAINALGTGYELRVIASTVIGGANLMGGEGGAYGAFIGAALLEVIRNSLLDAGHRFQLAGRLRRRLHRSRGSAWKRSAGAGAPEPGTAVASQL